MARPNVDAVSRLKGRIRRDAKRETRNAKREPVPEAFVVKEMSSIPSNRRSTSSEKMSFESR